MHKAQTLQKLEMHKGDTISEYMDIRDLFLYVFSSLCVIMSNISVYTGGSVCCLPTPWLLLCSFLVTGTLL